MQANIAVSRLKHLIAPGKAPWLRLAPEDGWSTLVLLAILVFTTISSIQSFDWTPGLSLQVLSWTTLAGLVLSYLVVQQGRLSSVLVHTVAIALGVVFAFKQTADTAFAGEWRVLWVNTQVWFRQAIIKHESSDDNSVFLLFLAILSFLLAYISVWLVLHTRRPWLAALATGVVLLINLNFATADKTVIYLVIFLMTTLLLLVRFTLAENTRVWRARGLRYSPDLSWDFMQAGAIFAVIVLLLAYLLPVGSANTSILSYWNSPDNPWQKIQNVWQAWFGGVVGGGSGEFGFFGSGLQLHGKVTLPDQVFLRYKPIIGNDPSQFLVTQTVDTYNGINEWTQSFTQPQNYPANAVLPTSAPANTTSIVGYDITLVRLPGATQIFAPGVEAQSFDLNSQAYISQTTNLPTAYVADARLQAGTHYQAAGYVSTATLQQLRAVPYPKDLPEVTSGNAYPAAIVDSYLNNLPSVTPLVQQTAREVTAGAKTMYDAAVLLEDYLRTFTYSLNNPEPPPGTDAITFFLQQQRGFCTHFASAMAIMGRVLGMPTRLALGFSAGAFDSGTQSYLVKGTQAHVWPQIYFAGYGWINFEPTSTFSKFTRAIGPSGTETPIPSTTPGGQTPTSGPPKGATERDPNEANNAGPQGVGGALVNVGLGLSLLLALALLFLALFLVWWRIIFRGLTPVSAAFARVSRLGAWAGAPPQRSQTPDEYSDTLGEIIPGERSSLRDLSGLYARERWGGGLPQEAGRQLPGVYEQVRRSLAAIIFRRVRHSPLGALRNIRRAGRRGRHRRSG